MSKPVQAKALAKVLARWTTAGTSLSDSTEGVRYDQMTPVDRRRDRVPRCRRPSKRFRKKLIVIAVVVGEIEV